VVVCVVIIGGIVDHHCLEVVVCVVITSKLHVNNLYFLPEMIL
jgi:hypothetical protein